MFSKRGLLVLAVLSFGSRGARAQTEAELLVAQYGVSFTHQFLGKVVRGENVWKAFRQTSYEVVPSAALQYAGMKLVGADSRYALPAQILTQKGAQIGRRSILGKSVLNRELLTTWELDYLWFNFRVRDGKPLFPRVNILTVATTLYYQNVQIGWRRSFATGAVVLRSTDGQIGNRVGREGFGVILMRTLEYENTFRHELVHSHQTIRGNALADPLLHQDDSQDRFLSFLRFNLGSMVNVTPGTFQRVFGDPGHYVFHEWEARAYSGSPN